MCGSQKQNHLMMTRLGVHGHGWGTAPLESNSIKPAQLKYHMFPNQLLTALGAQSQCMLGIFQEVHPVLHCGCTSDTICWPYKDKKQRSVLAADRSGAEDPQPPAPAWLAIPCEQRMPPGREAIRTNIKAPAQPRLLFMDTRVCGVLKYIATLRMRNASSCRAVPLRGGRGQDGTA